MLGFPLSQKSYVDFCYKSSRLFFFKMLIIMKFKNAVIFIRKMLRLSFHVCMVKPFAKFKILSEKFVSRSEEKSGNFFQIFGGNLEAN